MIDNLEKEMSAVSSAPETQGFGMNHTMLRTRDPRRAIEFYTSVLGMTLFKQLDFEDMEFTLFFLGYLPPQTSNLPEEADERTKVTFQTSGLVELTYNWSDGDTLPCQSEKCKKASGFGHLGISVPDVYAACQRMDKLGVKFIKRPEDGNMKGIAFIEDPDGYQIEILQAGVVVQICETFGAITTGGSGL